MIINGKDYSVVGYVKSSCGELIPVLDIPMMSDEDWQASAQQNAIDNYIKEFGKEPETIEAAVEWQRERCKRLIAENNA